MVPNHHPPTTTTFRSPPEPELITTAATSNSSTPFVSAPSSPGRSLFFSAPASPMHFVLSSFSGGDIPSASASATATDDFDLDLAASSSTMSSADELFSNGRIRPLQTLDPIYDCEIDRRRSRSLSPARKSEIEIGDRKIKTASSKTSKRWVFIKEFLRSKSEGDNSSKFWRKEKKSKEKKFAGKDFPARKPSPVKRRSAHEEHYTANRAQSEEMKKKTYLPYRQGLLGCLGFNSKSYGAINGFANALNPVSST